MVDDVVDRHLGIKRRSVVELDVVAHREFPRVGVRVESRMSPARERRRGQRLARVSQWDEEAELCKLTAAGLNDVTAPNSAMRNSPEGE